VNDGPAIKLDAATVPRLKPHVRLQFNEARKRWVVQAPERVLMPDEIAVTVLQRCDGAATIASIAAGLARDFDAPADVVQGDVIEMLQDLAEKGIIDDVRA